MTRRMHIGVALLLLAALGHQGFAGKGGGGGGGGGNTTPPDILFKLWTEGGSDEIHAIQDDGSGWRFLAYGTDRASWSPDGTAVAFFGEVDGPGIYVMDLDGDPWKVVATNSTASSTVAWSPAPAPDGEYKLAFTDYSPLSGRREIFLVNLDGTGLEQVSQLPEAATPPRGVSWSPDAGRIAFVTAAIRILDLTRPDASGLPAQHVVFSNSSSTLRSVNNPEWAKTGYRIAFEAYDPNVGDLQDIYVIDVAYSASLDAWTASAPANLTNTPNDSEHTPSWSPDDTRIVCHSVYWRPSRKGGGSGTLAIVPVGAGTRQTLFEARGGQAILPVWKRSVP